MAHAIQIKDVMERLPEPHEIQRLPRQYLINIIATVVGDEFSNWVQAKITERNEKMAKEKSSMISMEPSVYKAFMDCNQVAQ